LKQHRKKEPKKVDVAQKEEELCKEEPKETKIPKRDDPKRQSLTFKREEVAKDSPFKKEDRKSFGKKEEPKPVEEPQQVAVEEPPVALPTEEVKEDAKKDETAAKKEEMKKTELKKEELLKEITKREREAPKKAEIRIGNSLLERKASFLKAAAEAVLFI